MYFLAFTNLFRCVCTTDRDSQFVLVSQFKRVFMYSTHVVFMFVCLLACSISFLFSVFLFASRDGGGYRTRMHVPDVIRYEIGSRFATIVDIATTLLP